MPLGLWARVAQGTMYYRWLRSPYTKGQFLGKGHAPDNLPLAVRKRLNGSGGPKEALDGIQILIRRDNFRGMDMSGHAQPHSAVRCTQTAEPIEMPLALWFRVGSRNHVLDGVQIPLCEGAILGERTCPGMPDDTLS